MAEHKKLRESDPVSLSIESLFLLKAVFSLICFKHWSRKAWRL